MTCDHASRSSMDKDIVFDICDIYAKRGRNSKEPSIINRDGIRRINNRPDIQIPAQFQL